MTTALVQYSTGAGSALVAYRAIEKYGVDNTVLQTADTLVEDEDNWRFASEVWNDIGRPQWTVLRDGRTPMEVGRSKRCVPNNRMAVCSRILKRDLLRQHIDEWYGPDDTVVMLGFDWTEENRLQKALPLWEPYTVEAPLMEPPYMEKPAILDYLRDRGIEPPRLYEMGFSHANCGGACVRGGHAQWALLWEHLPDRYLEWEDEEEATRQFLDKDIAILRDRRGGKVKPLTLRQFREERLPGGDFERDDWGACGCFMEDEETE